MADLQTVLVQIVVGLVPLAVAWVAYRSASDANKRTAENARVTAERQSELERTKVDSEAFGRAKEIYEDALEALEKQHTRLQTQLTDEQETSRGLREKVAALTKQIDLMEQKISDLRRQIITAGLTPASEKEQA